MTEADVLKRIVEHADVMLEQAVAIKHGRDTFEQEADRAQGQADTLRVILSIAQEDAEVWDRVKP